ncbi:hypothetical protein OQA88_11236 [Cercophora sp. LCS_1]
MALAPNATKSGSAKDTTSEAACNRKPTTPEWTLVHPPESPSVQLPPFTRPSDGIADGTVGGSFDADPASPLSNSEGTEDDLRDDPNLTIRAAKHVQHRQPTGPRSTPKRGRVSTQPNGIVQKRSRRPQLPAQPPTVISSGLNDNSAVFRTGARLSTSSPPTTPTSPKASPPASPATTRGSRYPCPYGLRNPKQYPQCVYRDPHRSGDALREHLAHDHERPPYCPVCGETFSTHSECDAHIVRRECELSATAPVVDGLDSKKMMTLEYWLSGPVGGDKRGDDRTEYEKIWEVVFPSVPLPDLMNGGCGDV